MKSQSHRIKKPDRAGRKSRLRWLVFFRGIFGQRNLSRIVRKNPESYRKYAAGIFAGEAVKGRQDKSFIKKHQSPSPSWWAILGLALLPGCTTLGPMPGMTMASYIPQSRPGVELQAAMVPGAYLSDAVKEVDGDNNAANLGGLGQLAVHFNPGEWFGEATGITFGARVVTGGDSHPMVEPMIRYRRYIDPDNRFAVGGVLYGTYNDGEHDGSSFEMARFGGEVGLDVRVTPANRWIEVHVTSGASATGTWATGKYCAREDGYATDCDPEAGIFSNRKADIAGVFPAAFVGLSVDLFRDIPVLHGMRLGATAAGGTYPYLGNEEEPGSSAWYGFGLDFSVAFGAQ